MKSKISLTLLIVIFLSIFSFSCTEKEKKLDASKDVLFSVRGSEPILEITDKTLEAEIKNEITNSLLYFKSENEVFEMFYKEKRVDVYADFNKFNKDKKKGEGSYDFSMDEMKVTFNIEGKKQTFTLSGNLANVLYNHFIKRFDSGETNIIDIGVFCLHDDYTEYFKTKYPDAGITLAEIKTELVTCRKIETYK